LGKVMINFASEISFIAWDRRLYFHSEGSRAADFYRL
jgi:hypothetical protein